MYKVKFFMKDGSVTEVKMNSIEYSNIMKLVTINNSILTIETYGKTIHLVFQNIIRWEMTKID